MKKIFLFFLISLFLFNFESSKAAGVCCNVQSGPDCIPNCDVSGVPPSSNVDSASITKCQGLTNPLYGVKNKDLLGSNISQECLESGVENTFAYRKIIPYVIKRLLEIGSGIAVLMIVYSGILDLTMVGDEEQWKKAAKNILFVILGLFVMILARVLVSIIENLPLDPTVF